MNKTKQKSLIFAIKQGTMKTAEIKADLYSLIERTEDISILKALKVLLNKQFKEEKYTWDDFPEAVKKEIDEGFEDIEKGNVYTHEEVMQEMKEKYNIEL